MSLPPSGFLAVFIGSKSGSKSHGRRRASSASAGSDRRAPFFTACAVAAASASGVQRSTFLRAVTAL
jgi:hypothetical protein